MPIVTVDPEQYEKFDLKSAPPDGYVCLRPLPYGMKVQRRSKAVKMLQRVKPQTDRKKAMEQDQIFEMESMDEWAVNHDFAYCIGDHNLEDNNGVKLDFSNPLTVKLLNPRVGSEIETLIDKLNNDEDEESLEDFLRRADSSSTAEVSTLKAAGGGAEIDEETI